MSHLTVLVLRNVSRGGCRLRQRTLQPINANPKAVRVATKSLAALFFDEVAELTLHDFEGVVDDFVERLVGAVVHLLFVRDELVPRRDRPVDPAAVGVSFGGGLV